MNEQAKEVLAQLMQRALDGVDAAVEFSQQQIPDVVHQLLMWKAVESGLGFLLSVLMWVALIYGWIKAIPRVHATEDEEVIVVCYGLGVIGSFVYTLVSFIPFDLAWLKIWLAPKLYLLEYGASLIK